MKEPNIYTKLLQLQAVVTHVDLDSTGHGYKYASLLSIRRLIAPELQKQGLVLLHEIADDVMSTRIVDAVSGEEVKSTVKLQDYIDTTARMNKTQAYGSAITYMRRYTLAALLGIVADEDTDAQYTAPKPMAPKPANKEYPEKVNTSGNVSAIQHGDTLIVAGKKYLYMHGISKKSGKEYTALRNENAEMCYEKEKIDAVLTAWAAEHSNHIDPKTIPL